MVWQDAYVKSSSYIDEVVHEDVHRVDGVERNPDRVKNVLKSLARNISTLTTAEIILCDLRSNDRTFSEKTLSSDLNALRKIFLVEDVPAWSPSLCVRDLCVYAQPLDGEVRHYRDQTGLEVDIIVALKDGRWGAVEVKLGAADIDSAAQGLKRRKAKVDVSRMGHPSFLMVLTGTDLGYTREDGVIVCPLGCLKP